MSASPAVWTLARFARSANTVRKLAYYSLAVVFAAVPFALMLWAMVALSYSDLSNGAWAASCLAMFTAYIAYFVAMFED